ncbi:MAG: 4Fe-4S dicluster domain-containing protein [Gomphosphaeria aponina SAG 52.96 = DSM 107014]|uniref:4Fe-4S dicluster domain-containing protein n=1 Tax=Gomphosphaeria aponina SAG 52.96 = DSM 107014 TaxID=1521640 RepID=A0A941GNZ6_9CHRO|nr:4Fe-4S dicluster domain-containing protein [Gomphosphaeria aponina SAG 52.96 = DSM 107014]
MVKKKCFFGIKTDRQVDGDKMNAKLSQEVLAQGGENAAINACMQCGTCSGGCPNAERMDLLPRSLVLMVQRGEWEKVLKSQTLWLCSSCHTCTSRCPRGVRPTDVIEAVKAIAIREGIKNDSVRFNQIFVELIEKRGILFEPELMLKYGGLKALVDQAELGIKLTLKGKLSPFPPKVKEPKKFSEALTKAVKK